MSEKKASERLEEKRQRIHFRNGRCEATMPGPSVEFLAIQAWADELQSAGKPNCHHPPVSVMWDGYNMWHRCTRCGGRRADHPDAPWETSEQFPGEVSLSGRELTGQLREDAFQRNREAREQSAGKPLPQDNPGDGQRETEEDRDRRRIASCGKPTLEQMVFERELEVASACISELEAQLVEALKGQDVLDGDRIYIYEQWEEQIAINKGLVAERDSLREQLRLWEATRENGRRCARDCLGRYDLENRITPDREGLGLAAQEYLASLPPPVAPARAQAQVEPAPAAPAPDVGRALRLLADVTTLCDSDREKLDDAIEALGGDP